MSEIAPLREGDRDRTTDHDVVEHANLDQTQRLLETLGDASVRVARVGLPAGMVVGEDHRTGVVVKRRLHHLPRIDRSRVECAVEQLAELDHTVLGVQEDGTEHLVVVAGQLEPQELTHPVGGVEFHALGDGALYHLPRRVDDAVIGGRQVVAVAVAHEQLRNIGWGVARVCREGSCC